MRRCGQIEAEEVAWKSGFSESPMGGSQNPTLEADGGGLGWGQWVSGRAP